MWAPGIFFFCVCVCAKSSTFALRDDAFQPEKQRPEFSLIMKEGSRLFWFVTHLLKCVTKQIFVAEKPSSGRVNKICIGLYCIYRYSDTH